MSTEVVPSGFQIARLRIAGPAVPPAEVLFRPGLNVIAGASNTGKSYILQCVDYLLGATSPPKNIKESAGYTSAFLEIHISSGAKYVIERDLRGGNAANLFSGSLDDPSLGPPRKLRVGGKSEDTVSRFLLGLCNLKDKVILKSASGVKLNVSFRDLAHFCFIDETSIISEESPVYPTRQHTAKPSEMSFFHLLLTGEDAASVIAIPDAKIQKASWKAKVDLLDAMITEANQEIPDDFDEQIASLNVLESKIAVAAEAVASAIGEFNVAASKRNEISTRIAVRKSREQVIVQLLNRFELLDRHYESDMDRLRFLSEGDFLLTQLGGAHCPTCGTVLDAATADLHLADEHLRGTVQEGCLVESAKIRKKRADLAETVRELKDEMLSLKQENDGDAELLVKVNLKIDKQLKLRLESTQLDLFAITGQRSKVEHWKRVRQRHQLLTLQRNSLGSEPKQIKKKSTSSAETVSELGARRKFFDLLERRLRTWRLPNVSTVEFDSRNDIVVGGEPRRSNGKGIRAVIQSAFSISLMQSARMRHPGVVVLDSPLTSYKENDNYTVADDILTAFYTEVMSLPLDQQVIILENREPPVTIQRQVNYIHFTGDRSSPNGRVGLFPSVM